MTQSIQFQQTCVKRFPLFLIIAFSCFSIFAATPFPLHAAGVVTTCDESHLRAVLAGGGTVSFDCGGVITLTQPIDIATVTDIDGAGQQVTFSGGGQLPVFDVATGATLAVANLTIADGFGATGGGITNRGVVTVTNSTLVGNGSYGGGAIANSGTLTVINSTFADNFTSVYQFGGAGIGNYQGTVTVINSTFSANQSDGPGGGINNDQGAVALTNCTFFGNRATEGGGIYTVNGTLIVSNTVIAGTLAGGNCAGLIAAASTHNLSDDDTCGASFVQVDAATLNLGTLTNNGGPTATFALNVGSVAIDAGEDARCPATDQRGVVRPVGPHCDIGAFEFQPIVYLPMIAR
ncbi:MAG TPA: right-handed parallel beta-helix repeat-containing protein [Caldilineaceae bacterium]|nr:right-handed parallel beta-helix repeat-containing protein [Caldilineaceae bacterium]